MTGFAAPAALSHLRLADVAGDFFDVAVVGGGITGAGIARHAAACGLATLLLEADDFAAGTSSRSTKLIHGGLRYLAMGDIRLVREGALERKSLLAMAPHLIEPRNMLVPARSLLEHVKLRAGIDLYERLGAVARRDRHHNWRDDELAAGEPLLDRHLLPRACVYREYLTDDARLVIATLRAASARGAVISNYAPVSAVRQDVRGCVLTATDLRSGESHEVRARSVVNAAGPWVETLLAPGADAAGRARRRLYLSKGVHLVVPHERLPVRNMVMMTAADRRPVFAIPRGQVTYVGTTDTTHEGPAEHWPGVSEVDVDYLVETANAHFRIEPLRPEEVLATWAGLRPLINQPGKAPKEMSRRDEIWQDGAVVTVAGGKLTGFRRMAEEAMAAVARVLDRRLDMPEPLAPLPGGDIDDLSSEIDETQRRYEVDRVVATRLVRRYGSETRDVLGEHPAPLSPSVFAEEVQWAVSVEGARTLEDVVYRRLGAAWFLPQEVQAVVQGTAPLLADLLRWNGSDVERETALVQRRLADELRFRQSAASGASR